MIKQEIVSYENAGKTFKGVVFYDDKTQENRPNQGGTQLFNQKENISIQKRDGDRDNNRWWVPSSGNTAGFTALGATDTLDRMKVSESYDKNINTERIAPDILNAFRDNPYTHSLTYSV